MPLSDSYNYVFIQNIPNQQQEKGLINNKALSQNPNLISQIEQYFTSQYDYFSEYKRLAFKPLSSGSSPTMKEVNHTLLYPQLFFHKHYDLALVNHLILEKIFRKHRV